VSKKKLQAAMEEFISWLPNYAPEQRSDLVEAVARVLASLPGGDRFEDLGYEPFNAISWKEFEMISNIFAAIDDKWDVEEAAGMLLDDEGDGEE
jgi:hypothetical protein